MKAWIVERLSPEGEIRFAEISRPVPVGDQCLIRVEAAGLNFLDTLMIRGQYQVRPTLPFTPGVEVAGTVVEKGPQCSYSVSDRLCALIEHGGFAEFAIVPKIGSQRLPNDLPMRDAIAFPVIYPTSYVALRERAALKAGETILVLAGAGGVGSAAIQLAHHWGAHVIAAAGSATKTSLCSELGADTTIDYSCQSLIEFVRHQTSGRGVDVVFDPVGGQMTIDSLRCLAWGGRLIIVGFASGAIAELPVNRLLLKNASAVGVYWGDYRKHDPPLVDRIFEDLFHLHREGVVKPVVRTSFPFRDARRALKELAARSTIGKVVLVPE